MNGDNSTSLDPSQLDPNAGPTDLTGLFTLPGPVQTESDPFLGGVTPPPVSPFFESGVESGVELDPETGYSQEAVSGESTQSNPTAGSHFNLNEILGLGAGIASSVANAITATRTHQPLYPTPTGTQVGYGRQGVYTGPGFASLTPPLSYSGESLNPTWLILGALILVLILVVAVGRK